IKETSIVIDYVDNSERHSIQTLATIYGLPANWNLDGHRADLEADEFQDLVASSPNLELDGIEDIETLRASVDRIDLLPPPVVPEEISRFSRFSWRSIVPDVFTLNTPPARGIPAGSLEIRQNILGSYDIYKRSIGRRAIQAQGMKLERAVQCAE